jgi:hypothetical protein
MGVLDLFNCFPKPYCCAPNNWMQLSGGDESAILFPVTRERGSSALYMGWFKMLSYSLRTWATIS